MVILREDFKRTKHLNFDPYVYSQENVATVLRTISRATPFLKNTE